MFEAHDDNTSTIGYFILNLNFHCVRSIDCKKSFVNHLSMPYTFGTTLLVPCEINMYEAYGCEDTILNANFAEWKDS